MLTFNLTRKAGSPCVFAGQILLTAFLFCTSSLAAQKLQPGHLPPPYHFLMEKWQ